MMSDFSAFLFGYYIMMIIGAIGMTAVAVYILILIVKYLRKSRKSGIQ